VTCRARPGPPSLVAVAGDPSWRITTSHRSDAEQVVLSQSSRPRRRAGIVGTCRVVPFLVSPAVSVPGCPPLSSRPLRPPVRRRRPANQRDVPEGVVTRPDGRAGGRSSVACRRGCRVPRANCRASSGRLLRARGGRSRRMGARSTAVGGPDELHRTTGWRSATTARGRDRAGKRFRRIPR
jgi:hypothetical protein